MLETLDHVIVAVRDLNAASDQYARLLGREPSWCGEHPDAGTANSLFQLDNTYVELLSPRREGPASELLEASLDERGEGMLGLAFGAADAHACRRELGSHGLEPQPVEAGSGCDRRTGARREWLRVPLPMERTRGVLLFAIEHRAGADSLAMTAPHGEPAASVHALDHAVVRTSDAAAAKQLYGERLGLRLALDREFPDWGMRLLFFRIGGVTVEIAAALSPEPAPIGTAHAGDAFWGLSYRVADADRARERLATEGFDVSEVRPGRRVGTRVFSVRAGTAGVPTLMLEPPPRR